jgi:hypothetical protein
MTREERNMFRRINRELRSQGRMLRKSRSEYQESVIGRFYCLDTAVNLIDAVHVDLGAWLAHDHVSLAELTNEQLTAQLSDFDLPEAIWVELHLRLGVEGANGIRAANTEMPEAARLRRYLALWNGQPEARIE